MSLVFMQDATPVSSVPGSPVDGQIIFYIAEVSASIVPTYLWTFRYNAASAYSEKWEFIGGSALTFFDAAALSTSVDTGPTDLSGPSWTVSHTGRYTLRYGVTVPSTSAGGGSAFLMQNSTVLHTMGAHGIGQSSFAEVPTVSLVQGDVLKIEYEADPLVTVTFNQSSLSITPLAFA